MTVALLGAGLALPATAQERIEISLGEAQQRALAQNQMLEVAREGVAQAEGMRLQTWAGHLPSVSISERVMRTNHALSAFGFRLSQERVQQADFMPDALNDPEGITNFQTVLEVQQPLFNGGKTIYGRRQARAGVEVAEAQLQRGEQEVRLHTAEAYWGVVLAREGLEAVRQGLETAQAHAATAQSHFEQQTAPLSDLLAAQVRVAELRGEEIAAVNRVAQAADGLSLVMGLDSGVEVEPADTLSYREMEAALDDLVADALTGRADLA
ncbi:MAG: TolC family protein, partial [Gemmatimonadetes bacterium]|nr:TolC family protein [Gemmatimonadota bacterium]